MTYSRPVIVKQFPEKLTPRESELFFRDLEQLFEGDRPYLVLDLSNASHLDSVGIELLLLSLEEALKRNGDIKLASVPPQLAVVLEMTRVDCLFEIFESCAEAVGSFHRFSPVASGFESATKAPDTSRAA